MVDNPKKTPPMLFDVTKAENNESKTVDLGVFFPCIEPTAIKHNRNLQVRDIHTDLCLSVSVHRPLILKIWKRKHSIDWLLSYHFSAPSFARVLLNRSTIRLKVLDITTPLKNSKNALDIRDNTPIQSEKTHPDIFVLPPSIPTQVLRKAKKWIRPLLKWWIVIGLTISAMILLTLGIVTYIKNSTEDAYQDLINITKNFTDNTLFRKGAYLAENKLSRSLLLLEPFSFTFDNRSIHLDQVHTAKNVIEWWRSIARSAILLSLIRENLARETRHMSGTTQMMHLFSLPETFYPSNFLKSQKPLIEEIHKDLSDAIASYDNITTLWNPFLDEKFQQTLPLLKEGNKALWFFITNMDAVLDLLGGDRPKNYIILNQNRDEIRANGGFIGSLILAEMYKWRLTAFDKHDVYDFDWKIFPYRENPPEWINAITSNFGLRDANYYPDLKKTFSKVNFFFEKAGWRTLDGLIAINQGLAIDLLRIVWPIELGGGLPTINADNFSTIMSVLVEAKVIPYVRNKDGTYTSPKDLLFTFIDQIRLKMIEKNEWKKYIQIFKKHFEEWEIGIVFRDENLDKMAHSLYDRSPWKTIQSNWIYPVFTSISGNKSDRYMQRNLEITTQNGTGCTIITSVKLSQEHIFSLAEESTIRGLIVKLGIDSKNELDRLVRIQGRDANRSYIRFFVPRNAKLLDSNNTTMTVSNEESMTVFAAYLTTGLNKKSSIEFAYMTEPKTCNREIIVIKQPWLMNFHTSIDGK